jgi:nucleoid-associated protein YgaU
VRTGAALVCLAVLLISAQASATGGHTVVVEAGDTLSKIAARELGHPGLWPELYRANRDRIKDPERVYPGQELTVPVPAKVGVTPHDEAPGRATP